MPPFREGPIVVDRRFDGKALRALRDIGHGRRISIVDASYDIPEGMRTIKFPGSSADALLGIIRVIPVEDGSVMIMLPDPDLLSDIDSHPTSPIAQTEKSFETVERILIEQEKPIELQPFGGVFKHDNVPGGSDPGFDKLVTDPTERHLFVRTIDELPFACVSLVAGHSQKTE